MLPTHLRASLDASTWPVPPVLRWLKHAGGLTNDEFARTWNTGLGMVIAVPKERAGEAVALLEREGETVFRVGELVERRAGCGREEEEEEEYMVGDGAAEGRAKKRRRTMTMTTTEMGRDGHAAGADTDADADTGTGTRDEACVLANVHVWN